MATGSWSLGGYKLPEFGITEKLSNVFGQGRTAQGGSNLFGPANQTTLAPQSGGGFSQTNTTGIGSKPSPMLGSTPTKAGSSGTLSNTQQQPQQTSNPYGGMQQSAQDQANAELESALSEFDYQKENLQAQSGQLDTQRLSAMGTIDQSQTAAQKEATTAKTEATNATQTAQNKALSTAQDVQKKNRNVLRALGILSSSAGGEMLTKPMTEYGTQSAELQQGLVDRLGKVEDWWMTQQTNFAKAKTDLESQYASLKENISRDLRFNDRQRLTAVKAAGAALQQRMADIQQQSMAYQTAAKQYSDNILLKVAEMKMYQNPSADVSAIYNTLLSQSGGAQQSQQAGIMQSEEQKKKLLGSAI